MEVPGRTVGKMLAERLGILYDKQIIQMASDESGIDVKLFGKVEAGDKVKSSLFGSKDSIYKGGLHQPGSKDFISDENLFNYQAKVVNDLAEKESCVIVGRCVNYVFKDHPNTYAYSSMRPGNFVWRRLLRRFPDQREDVEKFLLKDDKRKQDYYRKFAGGIWNDATNYDLCLNSGKLGFEKCVDAIEAQLKIMLNK